MKIQNKSCLGTVSDLTLHARLVLQGLEEKNPKRWTAILVPVGEESSFPVLTGKRRLPFFKKNPKTDYERVYTLRIHELRGPGVDRLSTSLKEKIEDKTATLEELLEASPGHPMGFVRFAVTGSHGFSGMRRSFIKKFGIHADKNSRIKAIKEGKFKSPGVKVVPIDFRSSAAPASSQSAQLSTGVHSEHPVNHALRKRRTT